MTPVRTRVARSESTPSRPIFAKIAVSAAKTAERSAQKIQLDAVAMDRTASSPWLGRLGEVLESREQAARRPRQLLEDREVIVLGQGQVVSAQALRLPGRPRFPGLADHLG